MFSLVERPGWLRLKAFRPLQDNNLLSAGNTLTQRSFRTVSNVVTIRIDISHMTDGQHAGLCHFAQHSGCVGVVRQGGETILELLKDNRPLIADSLLGKLPQGARKAIDAQYLWLRSTWGLDGLSRFSYSLDGDHFTPLGEYRLSWGYYRGDRIGIYNYNNVSDSGYVDVDYLHYDMPIE